MYSNKEILSFHLVPTCRHLPADCLPCHHPKFHDTDPGFRSGSSRCTRDISQLGQDHTSKYHPVSTSRAEQMLQRYGTLWIDDTAHYEYRRCGKVKRHIGHDRSLGRRFKDCYDSERWYSSYSCINVVATGRADMRGNANSTGSIQACRGLGPLIQQYTILGMHTASVDWCSLLYCNCVSSFRLLLVQCLVSLNYSSRHCCEKMSVGKTSIGTDFVSLI